MSLSLSLPGWLAQQISAKPTDAQVLAAVPAGAAFAVAIAVCPAPGEAGSSLVVATLHKKSTAQPFCTMAAPFATWQQWCQSCNSKSKLFLVQTGAAAAASAADADAMSQ